MSDDYNKPVDFDNSAERVGQAAQDAAREMEAAAYQAAVDAAAAAQKAADDAARAAQQAADAGANKVDDLVEELNRVGGQVAGQARQVWESEQRKDLQDSVVKGLTSVANAVEEQMKKLAANPDTQRFLGKVEEATNKVVDQARGSKSLQEAAEAVMKGLNSAASAIERWLSQQGAPASPDATRAAATDEAQDIMIQRPAAESPAPSSAPSQTVDFGDEGPTQL